MQVNLWDLEVAPEPLITDSMPHTDSCSTAASWGNDKKSWLVVTACQYTNQSGHFLLKLGAIVGRFLKWDCKCTRINNIAHYDIHLQILVNQHNCWGWFENYQHYLTNTGTTSAITLLLNSIKLFVICGLQSHLFTHPNIEGTLQLSGKYWIRPKKKEKNQQILYFN